MSKGNSTEQVYAAVQELREQGQIANRESVMELTGLKLSIVDDRLRALVDDGRLRRLIRGVYELVKTYRARPSALQHPRNATQAPAHCSCGFAGVIRCLSDTKSLILALGIDQIHSGLLAGLAAQGEAFGQVVEDEQGAHCAVQALFVGQVQVLGYALTNGQGCAFCAVAGAFDADFIQAHLAGKVATSVAAATEQGQRRLLQQGGFCAAAGWVTSHDDP